MFKFDFKKIIEYGIYLLAFLLPWQTRLILEPGEIDGAYLEYLTYSLYAIDILLIILLLLFFWRHFVILKKSKKDTQEIPLIFWLIGGFELCIFISIFFSLNKNLALYNYLVFLFGIGIFWLLFKAEYKKKKLFYYFFGGIFIQAGLAIWQFLNQSSFASKWLGMADHNPKELGVSVIEVLAVDGIGERWLRAYGSLDHPNILGGVLAVSLLIIIGVYLNNIKQKSKQSDLKIVKNFNFKKYENILILIVYLIALIAFLFTFSRSAWLGFAVGLIIFFGVLILRKDFFKLKEFLILMIFSLFLSVLIFSQYSLLFKTRLTAGSSLENKSVFERVTSINDSLPIIRNNFWGVGIGNYSLALKEGIPDQYSWYYQPVHNTFLLIWAETGLFGILFFISLFLHLIYANWKTKSISGLPVLFALIIMMMFDHWWWSMHFGIFFLFFVFGLICQKAHSLKID